MSSFLYRSDIATSLLVCVQFLILIWNENCAKSDGKKAIDKDNDDDDVVVAKPFIQKCIQLLIVFNQPKMTSIRRDKRIHVICFCKFNNKNVFLFSFQKLIVL